MTTLGERIKTLRRSLGLTQQELAQKTRSTKQTIYKYEQDIVQNIPYDKIYLLAKALNTTPAHLMGWEDNTHSYDWDTDPEKRIDSIPYEILDCLLVKHHKDINKAWDEWWDINAQLFCDALNVKLGFTEDPPHIRDENILLNNFRSLNEKGQNLALDYLEGLTEVYKERK